MGYSRVQTAPMLCGRFRGSSGRRGQSMVHILPNDFPDFDPIGPWNDTTPRGGRRPSYRGEFSKNRMRCRLIHLQDVYILGRLLSHPLADKAKLPAILKLHEHLRLARTQSAAEKSRLNGMMYQWNHPSFLFNDPSHPDAPSRSELAALGNAIGESFAWLAEGHVEEDWAEAEAQMKATVS